MLSAVVGRGLPSCGGRPLWWFSASRVLLGLLGGAVGRCCFAWSRLSKFLLLSGLWGAAASLLLFGGLGGARGRDGPWGWLFAGRGLAASRMEGIVTLISMILIF